MMLTRLSSVPNAIASPVRGTLYTPQLRRYRFAEPTWSDVADARAEHAPRKYEQPFKKRRYGDAPPEGGLEEPPEWEANRKAAMERKEKTLAGGKKGRKRAVVSDMLARQRTANYLERKAQRKLEWSGVRKLPLRPETSLLNLTVGQWVDARVRGVNEKVCACGSLFLLYYYYYEPLS